MSTIDQILSSQDNLGQLRHAVEASLKDESLIWPSAEKFKAANNIADLDSSGLIPITEIPIDELKNYFVSLPGLFLGYYETEAALKAAHPTAEAGNYAIVGTTDTIWIWDVDTTNWVDSGSSGGSVTSVNGKTGDITIAGINGINVSNDGSVGGKINITSPTLNSIPATISNITLSSTANPTTITTNTTAGTITISTDSYTKSETDTALSSKQDELSADQLSAVNSGITANKVTTYDGYNALISSKADAATVNALDSRVATNETSITNLNTQVANKQDKTDNSLETTAKTIVGAINEVKDVNDSQATSITNLNTQVANKQDKTDNSLETTAKTIVGAINEVKDVNDSQATSITNLNNKTSIITEVKEGEGLISQNIAGDLKVNYNGLGGGGHVYVKSLVANKAVVASTGGMLLSANASSAEINYLTGTTSNIQTQINNLQSQLNLDHPTNTISAFIITPSSNTAGVSITDGSGAAAAGKGGKVIVSPTGTNVGAVYITTESTKPTALPLYPNTVVEFGPYTDLSDVLVYVDSIGDSVSVQISHV